MMEEEYLLGGLSLIERKRAFMKIIEKSQLIIFMKKVDETDDFDELYNLCNGATINYNNIVICKILEKDHLSSKQLKKIYYVRKRRMFKEIILLRMLEGPENEDLLWIIKVSKKNSAIREKAHQLLEQLNK